MVLHTPSACPHPLTTGCAGSSGGSSVGAEGRLALAQGVRMPQLEPLFLATGGWKGAAPTQGVGEAFSAGSSGGGGWA